MHGLWLYDTHTIPLAQEIVNRGKGIGLFPVCGPSTSRCGMARKNYGLLQIRTANTAVPKRLDSQCTIELSTSLYYSSSVSTDYSRIVAKH